MEAKHHLLWNALAKAAMEFLPDDEARAKALHSAAIAYAKARLADAVKPPARGPTPGTNGRGDEAAVIPFGRSKGCLVSEADTKDLEFVRRVLAESIEDQAKARWAESNQKLLDAVEAELGRR